TISDWPPEEATAWATCSRPLRFLRAWRTMEVSGAATARATAAPMPDEAPVMRKTRMGVTLASARAKRARNRLQDAQVAFRHGVKSATVRSRVRATGTDSGSGARPSRY